MANRSDLAIRVGAVLDSRQRRGRAGPFPVALGCAAAAVLVLTISPLRTVSAPQSASAQTVAGSSPATGAGAPLPSFEVASVKPNRSGDANITFMFQHGRFTTTGATIKYLIALAYNAKDFQVSGGASWISSDKYDIEAKESDSLAQESEKLPPDQRGKQRRLLLQSLARGSLQAKGEPHDKRTPCLCVGCREERSETSGGKTRRHLPQRNQRL